MIEQKLKDKVLKKYFAQMNKGTTAEDVKAALVLGEEFTPEEIDELMIDINAYTPKGDNKAVTSANPNDEIADELKKIDYKNLRGDVFKAYANLAGDAKFLDGEDFAPVTGKLVLSKSYDYIKVKAKPIRKARYKGIEGTPMDFVGLEIGDLTPLHTTRIPVRVALEHNAQITNQSSLAGHGTYYLLKK